MKILLHICCGPCTIYPLGILRQEGHEVIGRYDNPNIHPYREYLRRWETLEAYAAQEGLAVEREEGYPVEVFFRAVAFREEDRCALCYRLRLTATAEAAVRGDFAAFTTTLLYSRYQKHDLVRCVAEEVAKAKGIPFLYHDFREGWSDGVRLSRALGMYRQPYCGCLYSEKDRYALPSPHRRSHDPPVC